MKKFKEYLECDDRMYKFKNISGFCWYADINRFYLAQIEEDRPEFSNTIKQIRDFLANYTLGNADLKEKNQALNIFLLKNYGYTDKTEQDINLKGSISLDSLLTDAEDDEN